MVLNEAYLLDPPAETANSQSRDPAQEIRKTLQLLQKLSPTRLKSSNAVEDLVDRLARASF